METGRPRYGIRRAAYSALAAGWLAAAPASAACGETRITILGDSLTAGYGLTAADALPERLEAALRARGIAVEVVDAGVSGDTSAGGLARLDWLPGGAPDRVILALGANDGLRGLDPAAMAANLSAIVERLQAAGVPVLLAGMRAPPNLGPAYGRVFDAVFPELAARHGLAFYPFLLDGVAAEPALNQPDGLHPNPAGVAEMVARIAPLVASWLEGAPRRPGGCNAAAGQ